MEKQWHTFEEQLPDDDKWIAITWAEPPLELQFAKFHLEHGPERHTQGPWYTVSDKGTRYYAGCEEMRGVFWSYPPVMSSCGLLGTGFMNGYPYDYL